METKGAQCTFAFWCTCLSSWPEPVKLLLPTFVTILNTSTIDASYIYSLDVSFALEVHWSWLHYSAGRAKVDTVLNTIWCQGLWSNTSTTGWAVCPRKNRAHCLYFIYWRPNIDMWLSPVRRCKGQHMPAWRWPKHCPTPRTHTQNHILTTLTHLQDTVTLNFFQRYAGMYITYMHVINK